MVVMAAASVQNTRILRFLIVLAAVVVTIFIYASYSTNSSMTPQLRMRSSEYVAMRQQQTQVSPITKSKNISTVPTIAVSIINKDSGNSVSIRGQILKTAVDHKKSRHHYREPTIDKDADANVGDETVDPTVGIVGNSLEDIPDEMLLERLDHNDLLDEQYEPLDGDISDKINNTITTGNIATNVGLQESLTNEHHKVEHQYNNEIDNAEQRIQSLTGDKNNLNKIPDSEVLIPTSNLQKFIENADKILKNITTSTDNNKVTDEKTVFNESKENKNEEQVLLHSNEETNQKDRLNKATVGEINNINVINDSKALPPSALHSIKHPNTPISAALAKHIVKASSPSQIEQSSKSNSINKNSSTSRIIYSPKGIPTSTIYEGGHLNNEIDIEKICPDKGSNLKLLILITSAQDHMLARLAIRQTWGHYGMRRDVATAFVLGRTVNDTINKALTQENLIYGDLIRGNFIDSYNNLTLKTISSLGWVDEHCPRAKYVLKTDDDMFINVPKLLAFVDSHAKEKRVIFGRLAKKWKPVRNKKSKYYVSPEQFSAAVFPSFTTGPAYLLTGDIVHELYERSLQTVYLKLEDVFTTGIVSQQLGVRRLHANEFLNRRIAFNPCNIRKAISIHMIKANEQFDLWKKLLDQTAKCK